jgi:hypothetical protein
MKLRIPGIYVIILIVSVIIFIVIELMKPREVSWELTFSSKSSMPYGTLVLSEMLPQIFPDKEFMVNKTNYYELEMNNTSNFVFVNNEFEADEYSMYSLLDIANDGGNVFISAFNFNQTLLDTLNLSVLNFWTGDEDGFNFINDSIKNKEAYKISYQYNSYFFLDSCKQYTPLSSFNNGNVNFLSVNFGKGKIYMNSTPLAFTNYYILKGNVIDYVEKSLSMMEINDVVWDEYQQKQETGNQSTLQFIGNNPPLTAAYYIALILIILFVVFYGKRRQKTIPVLEPLKNNSLDFAETISHLYYQQKDHKDIVNKRILYFLDYLNHRYHIKHRTFDEKIIGLISSRSALTEEEIRALILTLQQYQLKDKINDDELVELNKKLEKFYKQ